MLKKLSLSFMCAVILLFGAASGVSAKTSSRLDKASLRAEVRETVRENTEGLREQAMEGRAEAANRKSAALDNHCTVLEARFAALIKKIEARITRLKGEGKTTTTAEEKFSQAKTALTDASALCDQAVAKFDSVPVANWSTQNPILREAHELAKKARAAYVKVHQLLAQTLRALAATK